MIQRLCLAFFYATVFLINQIDLSAQSSSIKDFLTLCQEAIYAEDPQSADQYCSEALALAISSKDTLSWAHALVLAGDVADLRYQQDSALLFTQAAKDLIDYYQAEEGPFNFSFLLYQNLGVHYSRAGRYDLQMQYYQQAFSIAKVQSADDCALMAGAYQNLIAAYYNAHDVERAFAYADTSNQLAESCGRLDIVSRNYNNLGGIYADIGEYQQAISYQRKSLELGRYSQAKVSGLLNLATYLMAINREEAAIASLQEAKDLTKDPEQATFYKRAEVISSLAFAYFEAGNMDLFLQHFEEGVDLFFANYTFDPEYADYYSYTLQLNYYAGYQIDQNQPHVAIEYAKQSLAIAEAYYPDITVSAYLIMGEAHELLADFPLAESYFQKAIALSTQNPEYESSQQNPPVEDILGNRILLELLMRKADLLERYGSACDQAEKWAAAVQTCHLIDSVFIASRKQVFSRQSKTKLSNLAHQVYSTAITALYQLYAKNQDSYYLDQAFYFSEKDKNILLAETLSGRSASEGAKISKDILKAEQELPARINYFKNLLLRNQEDPGQIKIWQDSLFELGLQQRALLNIIEQEDPIYFGLKYSNQAINIAEVRQNLLASQEVLLEYFLTDKFVYLILIDSDRKQFHRLPLEAPLGQQINQLLKMGAEVNDSFGLQSYRVYQQLLAPVEAEIKDKNFVIVADAAIGQIPFEALRITPLREGPAKIDDFLLAHHSIRHLFSAQVANQQKQKRKKKYQGLILSVSPDFTLDQPQPDSNMQLLANDLKELVGARNIQYILEENFPAQVKSLTGPEATKQLFRDIADGFQVIHVATHALLDDDSPEFSRLVFSLQNAKDTFEVCLHAYEILGMDLQADLVTLSACNTAIGNPNAGDGIAGLGHAFAFAGSANLISTLWPIRDDQATALMDEFYSGLAKGLSKPEALRQAKLSFLFDHPAMLHHPHFWAGFIYSGDGEPLDLNKSPLPYYLICLFLCILAGVFTYRKRNNAGSA